MYVHRWLVHVLNFKRLCTDFTAFKSTKAEASGTVPRELMQNHREAQDLWSKLMSGRMLFMELGMQHEQVDTQIADEGISIVITCPEPGPAINCLCRVLQENIIMLHELNVEFRIGLLMNIQRLPLKRDMKEDVMFGLQLVNNSVLDPHFWPLIDKVHVLRGAQCGMFGAGRFPNTKGVTKFSNYAVIEFSNRNAVAKECIRNLRNQHEVDQSQHELMKWGCHKTDWQYLDKEAYAREVDSGYMKDPRLPLWKYIKMQFPACQLIDDVTDSIVYEDEADGVSVRLSMDIHMKPWNQEKEAYEEVSEGTIRALIESWVRAGADSCPGVKVSFNPNFRLSWAHGSKPHKSHAPETIRGVDITVTGPSW